MSASALSWSTTPRITLNLARLVADGRVTADEAEMLLGLAESSRLRRIMVNLLLIFGALMVVGGVLALKPTLETGLAMALASLGLGTALFAKGRREWGLLGRALIHMGLLGLSGWITMQFWSMPEPWPNLMWPVIAPAAGGRRHRLSRRAACRPCRDCHWLRARRLDPLLARLLCPDRRRAGAQHRHLLVAWGTGVLVPQSSTPHLPAAGDGVLAHQLHPRQLRLLGRQPFGAITSSMAGCRPTH